jgi:hypothetical protein
MANKNKDRSNSSNRTTAESDGQQIGQTNYSGDQGNQGGQGGGQGQGSGGGGDKHRKNQQNQNQELDDNRPQNAETNGNRD